MKIKSECCSYLLISLVLLQASPPADSQLQVVGNNWVSFAFKIPLWSLMIKDLKKSLNINSSGTLARRSRGEVWWWCRGQVLGYKRNEVITWYNQMTCFSQERDLRTLSFSMKRLLTREASNPMVSSPLCSGGTSNPTDFSRWQKKDLIPRMKS